MSGILIRDQRIAALKTLFASPVIFPGTNYGIRVKLVESGGGPWTDEQRRERQEVTPCVILSCDGTSPVDYPEVAGNGSAKPNYVMSCVVVARDEIAPGVARLHRSDVAQAIAEVIAGTVFYERPEASTNDIGRFRMENAWLAVDDRNDVGMWAMTWEEGGELPTESTDELPDLIECRTFFTIAENGDQPQMIANAIVQPDGVDTEAP